MKRTTARRNRRSNRKNNKDRLGLANPNMVFGGGAVRAPGFGPSITLTRRVDGLFDIITNGISANFGSYNVSLNDLPNYAEFTALFQTYSIEKVAIVWRPEYTTLSDAAPVSNAVNTSFNTALNVIGATPTSVNDVLQYSRCNTTQINVPQIGRAHV